MGFTVFSFEASEKWFEANAKRRKKGMEKARREGVEIQADGTCGCHCGIVCPLGRSGAMLRCTKKELEQANVPVR